MLCGVLRARREILERRLTSVAGPLGQPDIDLLVEATEGFSGADVKRLVEDGKNLYAYDRALEEPLQESTDYYLRAVETVIENRVQYEAAEARSRSRQDAERPGPPSGFGPFPGMPGFEPDD